MLFWIQDVVQEYGEQRTEKNLEELQANHLKVQHVLTLHKVSHQKCVGEARSTLWNVKSP